MASFFGALGRQLGLGEGLLALAQALQQQRVMENEGLKTSFSLMDLLGKGQERQRKARQEEEDRRKTLADEEAARAAWEQLITGSQPQAVMAPQIPSLPDMSLEERQRFMDTGSPYPSGTLQTGTRQPTPREAVSGLAPNVASRLPPAFLEKQFGTDPRDEALSLLLKARQADALGLKNEADRMEAAAKASILKNATPEQAARYAKIWGGVEAPAQGLQQPAPIGPGDVSTMRAQFNQLSKDFITVRDAYARIEATSKENSAAGDLSLIFSFMKLLDPNSVVRESEFATAQNAAGVPDQIRNLYNRIMTGERLSPRQHADFLKQSQTLFGTQLQSHQLLEEQYRGAAQRSGVPPDQVVIDFVGQYRNRQAPAPSSQQGTGLKGAPSTQDLLDEARRRGLVK